MRRPQHAKSAIGATRNHTSSFLQLREQSKKRDYGRPSDHDYDHAAGWEAARHRLPPRWVEIVEGCNQSIADIRSKRTWGIVSVCGIYHACLWGGRRGRVWGKDGGKAWLLLEPILTTRSGVQTPKHYFVPQFLCRSD